MSEKLSAEEQLATLKKAALDRQKAYMDAMKSEGFVKVCVWVHESQTAEFKRSAEKYKKPIKPSK